MRKGTWAATEDNRLLSSIKIQMSSLSDEPLKVVGSMSMVKIDWVSVAAHVKTRTGKQCRERWVNHLNPEIIKSQWTTEEDKKLVELGRMYPGKWAAISRKIKGRSQNQVKIRWNSLTNSSRRQGKRKAISELPRPSPTPQLVSATEPNSIAIQQLLTGFQLNSILAQSWPSSVHNYQSSWPYTDALQLQQIQANLEFNIQYKVLLNYIQSVSNKQHQINKRDN